MLSENVDLSGLLPTYFKDLETNISITPIELSDYFVYFLIFIFVCFFIRSLYCFWKVNFR